jgi:3-phenylpropionate/trans-cinnamate dioxygenase ferredoxin reductase component
MTRRSNGRPGSDDGIVIVGGGLAGQRCAEALRRNGCDRAIRVVCAEPHRPYDRPPLSKQLLTDAGRDATLTYRPAEWYAEQSIDLLLGVRATDIDPSGRRLSLSDQTALRYEQLLICTGSRPRNLPVLSGYENVSVLRTVDDARCLREVLATGPRLAVVGAGFIGLELAATARGLGVEVSLLEAAQCPLGGVLGTELGQWFARLHTTEGVDVRTQVTIERVEGEGAVRVLRLSDGSAVEVDHVVVGVGVEPEVAWLAGSGLDTTHGIAIDALGRTAIDGVYAAGDAAATFDATAGRHVPGSHWEAAGRQGALVGRVMLGIDPGVQPLTSFWTDQYGLRIHYVGQGRYADSIQIDGDPDSRNFTATYYRAGRAIAALLVDRPRALPAARNLIQKGSQ